MTTSPDRLIGIVDLQQILTRNEQIEAVVARALSSRVRNILLRAKHLPQKAVDEVNWSALIERTERAGARVILHDSLLYARPELAERSMFQHWSAATLAAHVDRATRVQDGTQKIVAPSEIDKITPPPLSERASFGVSAHNTKELIAAQTHGAAWAFVSPFALTMSKPGYGPALGVTGTHALCAQTSLPIFALGGINAKSFAGAGKSGISGVVVMGMLTNPQATLEIKALLNQMESEAWTRQPPWS